jgi:transketolase
MVHDFFDRPSDSFLPRLAECALKARRHSVLMTHRAGASHVGSSLSVIDILIATYSIVRYAEPLSRVLVSKGHSAAGVYSSLAVLGFFPESDLETYCMNGSRLSGHVSHVEVSGVDFSTGSLGHALPVAAGMGLADKRDKKDARTFVVLSDGECDEGSNWEAALFCSHHKLSNVVAIIDRNGVQSLGPTEEALSLEPLGDKWRAFGWHVLDSDGHDIGELLSCLDKAKLEDSKPTVIIAKTTKGNGVSFMEGDNSWHYRSPQGEDLKQALLELEGKNS